jgi:hypothetical protein
MSSEIELKILNPTTDLSLYHEAYGWRERKRHIGADEAPFDAIIADDPRQIVIGVFNGQFCAMFLLYEDSPGYFNCHFTSKRGTARDALVAAGAAIRDAFLNNGAVELCAWITAKNRALAGYLESLGFAPIEQRAFVTNKACQNDTDCSTIPSEQPEPPARMFTKYAIRGEFPRD